MFLGTETQTKKKLSGCGVILHTVRTKTFYILWFPVFRTREYL
jgi:hypothetical protein